jgi:molybdopterin-guanine dinucleotide biosynthesis protein
MTLKKVGVGGFASNTGKTTLVCELLRALPGWEAIKVTRGHYRSCGKDAHACCVSHLLGDEPLVLSERARTDARGKDTGRYWEAGASDVHWVVATDRQVERGIKEALGRVAAAGVIIEGNSFSQFVETDFFVMVAGPAAKIKPTARRALAGADALYLPDGAGADELTRRALDELAARQGMKGAPPLFTRDNFADLVEFIRASLAGEGANAGRASRLAAAQTL